VETKLGRDEISLRTGFELVEYLSVVFKQHTGMTMREYGQQHVREQQSI
jgi:AraC-like DNA-binding protein